ncbi:MAG: hypothetical protein KJ957_01615 [Candidatus Omnitrophica bacterium]|nr:hypothetical protein [Candidatus Omnitrophota bacterium]MBU1852727.1 hypothetical protein [Candidatus Omnitrophota bacterium]
MIKKTCLFTVLISLLVNYSFAVEKDTTQLAQMVLDDTGAVGNGPLIPITGGMQGKISLDLRNIDIIDALKFVALKAGLNIITTKKVTGRISLTVENVLIKDIFDIMLRSNELAYMKQGDIYNIMTEKEYRAIFGKNFADIRQVKTFRLKYAIPDQAFSLFDTLKSDIGRVLVEPDSGTALIMDTPENIIEIERALATMEQENLVQVFTLKYAMAKDIEEQLKLRLDAKKVGSVKADERSNLIVVQALPERMQEVEKLIAKLDTKTKEVLIDAQIIKIKLIDQVDYGVEWEGIHNLGQQYGMTYLGNYPFSAVQATTDTWRSRQEVVRDMAGEIGSIPFSGTATSYAGGSKTTVGENMHIGMIDSKRDLDFLVKYLQTLGNTQILSNPKLAVINNQEARIHVGERQAYVTTTTTTGQTTTTVSEEVTFIDVGIQLSVTPTINDDGYITMKIKPEISSVTSTLTTPSGNQIPIIDTSTTETTVMVKDGTTIVIGGMRREEEAESTEKVPFLGNIPLLGNLFRSTTKSTDKTELLIMLTPHIVTGDFLTTGDAREYGYMPGKDYEDYSAFTTETDFEEVKEPPEEKVKPYKEYSSDLKDEIEVTEEGAEIEDESPVGIKDIRD